MSLGGPPKAVLGGPNRKVSPLPPAAETPPAPAVKGRKVVIKLPQETIVGEEEQGSITRASWARTPLRLAEVPEQRILRPPELRSAEPFLTDSERQAMPGSVDVFLPGKVSYLSTVRLSYP